MYMEDNNSKNYQKKHAMPEYQPPVLIFLLVLGCFFISGLTGLTYEILWTRMIVKIIGSSPFAVSIVLTVFMAGLGFGSYLAGKTIDRVKAPEKLIQIYGWLELTVGAYGLVLPLLLTAFKPLYAVLYNHLFNYFLTYNLITFFGCAVLLIIPVTCMGATLPVLSRFFVTSLSKVGTHVGRLYGLNTIGAAVGSILCGFWLINLMGVWGALIFAIFLNAAIGIVCIMVSQKYAGKILPSNNTGAESSKAFGQDRPAFTYHDSHMVLALVIFAVSGFCAMAYEVIWVKLLGLLVGPTTYSFTIVLVTFITGLALGSMFFGWLGDRIRNTILLLILTQTAAALTALIFSQVMGNSQIFFAKLIYEYKDSFAQLYLLKASVLFAFMVLPTFFLGATFPLVGKIYTHSLAHTARSIGFAYAINSIGTVLGSFSAGFLLIPFLGKEDGIKLVVTLQLFVSLIIGFHLFRKSRKGFFQWVWIPPVALAGLLLVYFYPNWNHTMLSKGKYHRFDKPEIREIGWLDTLHSWERFLPDPKLEKLIFYGDGIGGFTTVLKGTDLLGNVEYGLCNSGKPDASSAGDMDTQTLSAHLPMLFHPHAKDVLIIGLASGITAGEILYYPVENLDVVEINEQVVAASHFFMPWNNNVLADPRTHLIIQDGRAHLELSKKTYDVISSEPSNPWMAGLSALFTKDFFELAKNRLNDGGIFVQFIHSYQMDWKTFALVGRTFVSVFPNSLLVSTNPARSVDYLLVGFKSDHTLQEQVALNNLSYAQKSKNICLSNHTLFYNFVVAEDLSWFFGKGPVNTDANPILEFAAPKLMHVNAPEIAAKIMSNRETGLTKTSRKIVYQNMQDIGRQIDLAAYFLFLKGMQDVPLQYHVNFGEANTAQKRRYSTMVKDYCKQNLVTNLSSIPDMALREECFTIHYEATSKRLNVEEDKALVHSHLGNFCLKNGKPEKAMEHFSSVVALNPQNAKAQNNLGTALATCKRMKEAIHHFKEAIKIKPNYAKAHSNLGSALATQGRPYFEKAIPHFKKALELNPEDAKTNCNLGMVFANLKKFDEAVHYINKAVQLDPGDPEILAAFKHITVRNQY